MGTTLKHLILSGLGGMLLAAFGWFAWWLGSLALGASASDQLASIWLALGVGGVSAATAGAGVSLLGRRSAALPTGRPADRDEQMPDLPPPKFKHDPPAPAKPAHAKQPPPAKPLRRRRHPFEKGALRARLSATLRWRKIAPPLLRLLGIPADHLIGQPILRLVHPEDVPAFDKALEDARKTRQVIQTPCRFTVVDPSSGEQPIQANGTAVDTKELPTLGSSSFLHFRLEIFAFLDYAGKPKRYDLQIVDLTPEVLQRKQEMRTARREMSNAKKRWRSLDRDLARLKLSYQELYHNAPVMYFSINADGKLVTFNDTLLRTLGYERAELHGHSYTELLAPALLKNQVNIAQSMPSHEGELETLWRKRDGTLIHVWLHTVPVYDDQGRFARYRSAALDLTEKSRLANELRARGDELERTNQRLRLINTELEDFTHVVSHDLKEPLRTLQAYSHILAEEHAAELGPDGFQYINHLIRASRRLGALIDELLNLSQAGRITRAPKAFNLIEIVATVRQDLVDLIQRKQAMLLTEGSLPDVIGDSVRITQLLANLVANGLKYNQTGTPRVTIGAVPCADDPNRVTVFVRDNGIGIDPAFHEQIFGIFRRLHQGDEYEGTGAGLAICKKIVEGHGGRIWLESQPGAGATFFFTLPGAPAGAVERSHNGLPAPERRIDASPSSASRRNLAATGESDQAPTRSPRIVLVEDQPEVAMIIEKLGKRDGLAITWFPTAEDAWEHLQRHRADLLLLDVNLPGMNGVELCRKLRTLAHLDATRIAIFTPEQEPGPLNQLREAGADFFLTKDLLCNPTSWQQKMQELLELVRQPAAH